MSTQDCCDRSPLLPTNTRRLYNRPECRFLCPGRGSASELIVPTLSLHDIFRRVLQQRGEGDALQAVAVMVQGTVVDLDMDVALSAARLSIDLKLPLADSVMLATSQRYEAIFWTQDAHFAGVPGVQYRKSN